MFLNAGQHILQTMPDMHVLKTKCLKFGKNLEDVDLSVTKSEIPFVLIGSDNACEHLNRVTKVRNGFV